MKRTHLFLSDEALAWLHNKAKSLGINLSELIRRIVDKERGAR
jgi:hypothetical protein